MTAVLFWLLDRMAAIRPSNAELDLASLGFDA